MHHEINADKAIDYIFTELCKEGKPCSEDDIRLVLQLFSEYLARNHPEIEVELEDGE